MYGSYLIQAHRWPTAHAAPSIATTYKARLDLTAYWRSRYRSRATEEIVELEWAACGARTLAITNGGASSPLAEAASRVRDAPGSSRRCPRRRRSRTQRAALAVRRAGPRRAAGPRASFGRQWRTRSFEALPGRPTLTWSRSSAALAKVPGAVVSGRGTACAAALELALKLKEACYLHAMELSLRGPVARAHRGGRRPDVEAIVVASDSGAERRPAASTLARRVTGAGASAFGIGGGAALAGACTASLPGPALPGWLAPIGLIVPRPARDRGARPAAWHQTPTSRERPPAR